MCGSDSVRISTLALLQNFYAPITIYDAQTWQGTSKGLPMFHINLILTQYVFFGTIGA